MLAVLAASLLLLARAQSIPASASDAQVQFVEAEYNNSGFNTALPNSQSFGIPLEGQGLLTVAYNGTVIENGQDYSKDAVASLPTIYFTPTSEDASNFTSGNLFTLMLADASAVGGPDSEGDYRHYLANSVAFGDAASSSNVTVSPTDSANVITYYAGPGPLPDSGEHRYAWLLFQQPSTFAAPSGLDTAGVSPSHWSVSDYVSSSGLGDLVGASFFTVTAEGTPSFTAGSTSAASSATASTPASASAVQNAANESSDASSLKRLSMITAASVVIGLFFFA